MENRWKYQVRILSENTSNKLKKIIEEKNFETFPEAMKSLLDLDLKRFRPATPPARDSYSIEVASILNIQRECTEVFIDDVKIEDALYGGAPAGIYLHSDVGSILELGDRLQVYFGAHRNYDPGLPVLQLARMTYDEEIKLTVDRSLTSTQDQLAKITGKQQYYFSVEHQEGATMTSEIFCYKDLSSALASLFHSEYLDPDWIRSAVTDGTDQVSLSIRDHNDNQLFLVENTHRPKESRPIGGELPGVYLNAKMGLRASEQITGIVLNHFPRYGNIDQYLMIATVDPSSGAVIYPDEFVQLRYCISVTKSSPPERFRLDLNYETTQTNQNAMQGKIDSKTSYYESLQQGFEKLYQLDSTLFDKTNAENIKAGKFIQRAVLYDEKEREHLASKFCAPSGQGQLPPGIYIQLNSETLTKNGLDTMARVMHGQHTGGLHFLIGEIENLSPDPVTLKHTGSVRVIMPTDPHGKSR